MLRQPMSEPHTQDVVALYAWRHEWSEVAKMVIKLRDLLIRLGLATPTKRAKNVAKEPGGAAVTTG